MKFRKSRFFRLLILVLCASTAAYARPVGTLQCSSSNGQVKFNISYFTFGLANATNLGSQSSGAGAGKVTFQPLEVHAALTTFASLADTASQGVPFQSCILSTTFRDGSEAQFEFKLVVISSLAASASMADHNGEAARYTDINFEYGAVEVKTSSNLDDGGTTPESPGSGWNRVSNN